MPKPRMVVEASELCVGDAVSIPDSGRHTQIIWDVVDGPSPADLVVIRSRENGETRTIRGENLMIVRELKTNRS